MSWIKSRHGYLGSVFAILITSYENLSKFLNFSAFMPPTDNGDYSGTLEGASCYCGRSWIWLKNWYNWTNPSWRNLSLYTVHLHQHLLSQPNTLRRKCTYNIIPGPRLALRLSHGRKSRESENELLLLTLCTPHAASWTVFPVHSTSGLPLSVLYD